MSAPDESAAPPQLDAARIRTVLCDLDGVVWLAHRPIAGSASAIDALRASGRRVLFVTNNSVASLGDHESALAAIGIPARGDVISSAGAAARLIEPGENVLVTGGPGIVEAVRARGGVAITNDGDAPADTIDAVIVGLDRDFDYRRLAIATTALRAGARLIGTNSDPTFPTPHGLEPGGGALLAAVAAASGQTPVIAGKPHPAMASLIAEISGVDRSAAPAEMLMVGDRPDTDGLMAHVLGCPFALVRTGVTQPGDAPSPVEVALDVADLAAVAAHLTAAAMPPVTPTSPPSAAATASPTSAPPEAPPVR